MFLTHRLLRFRNEHVDLFRRGNYLPIAASGTFAECCVSFARELYGQWIVVILPRLSSRVGFPPIGEKWQDTSIEIPETLGVGAARNIFVSEDIPLENRRLMLRDALSKLPFAVITNVY